MCQRVSNKIAGYTVSRIELYDTVPQYCNITTDELLCADELLSYETNAIVFETIHKSIQSKVKVSQNPIAVGTVGV